MTASERDALRRAIDEARRARVRFAPNAGARSPGLRPVPVPGEFAARSREQRERELALVERLDEWEWEAAC